MGRSSLRTLLVRRLQGPSTAAAAHRFFLFFGCQRQALLLQALIFKMREVSHVCLVFVFWFVVYFFTYIHRNFNVFYSSYVNYLFCRIFYEVIYTVEKNECFLFATFPLFFVQFKYYKHLTLSILAAIFVTNEHFIISWFVFYFSFFFSWNKIVCIYS